MIKIYKFFFSHSFLISDIKQKRFRVFYGIAILFFICSTIYTFQPSPEIEVLESSLWYMPILDSIIAINLIYSIFVLKKSGWYIFVGTLISVSLGLIRFLLVMSALHLVEFIFHLSLIKMGLLSSKTINSAVGTITFISFVYYYFILMSFLIAHYKSENVKPA